MNQKAIEIKIEAPYATYGELSESTHTIWLVCHGYGQLAHRFIRRFDVLDSQKHFVIAPQGLSKFYLAGYQKVGASWMTKENRLVEIENYLNYLDAVFQEETSGFSLEHVKLNLLGFSQGVTTIARWAYSRKVSFDKFIIWAGGFPHELKANEFRLPKSSSRILAVLGEEDEFFNKEKFEKQLAFVTEVTGQKPTLMLFKGKHEIKREVLLQLVKNATKVN